MLMMGFSLNAAAVARTWTDDQDRKVDAEIVRVEGDEVVLKSKGREINVPTSKLSKEDQQFIEQWVKDQESEKPANAPVVQFGDLELCGKALKSGGRINIVEEALSKKVIKTFSSGPNKPSMLKIGIAFPEDFDPAKPQRVLWVSAAINNDDERRSGNIGMLSAYAHTAVSSGWIVIAADTDQGNPRGEDNQRSNGADLAIQTAAINTLSTAWPNFTNWNFACAGFSGGAKASFYRVGDLLVSDLNVVGLFLAGCNQNMTDDAREETNYSKSDIRKIKVLISNGRKDPVSTIEHAEKLKESIKDSRYGDIRLELHEGGHMIKREALREALAWFAATEE